MGYRNWLLYHPLTIPGLHPHTCRQMKQTFVQVSAEGGPTTVGRLSSTLHDCFVDDGDSQKGAISTENMVMNHGGLEQFLFSKVYMGCHPSHWRTHMFQRGWYTTNQPWDFRIPDFQTPFGCWKPHAREAPRRSGARSTERSKSKSSGFQMWSDGVAGWWFGTFFYHISLLTNHCSYFSEG